MRHRHGGALLGGAAKTDALLGRDAWPKNPEATPWPLVEDMGMGRILRLNHQVPEETVSKAHQENQDFVLSMRFQLFVRNTATYSALQGSFDDFDVCFACWKLPWVAAGLSYIYAEIGVMHSIHAYYCILIHLYNLILFALAPPVAVFFAKVCISRLPFASHCVP